LVECGDDGVEKVLTESRRDAVDVDLDVQLGEKVEKDDDLVGLFAAEVSRKRNVHVAIITT